MSKEQFIELLTELVNGETSVEALAARLERNAFIELGGVTVDIGRRARTGAPEVVFSEGKDLNHLRTLAESHRQRSEPVLFTRVKGEQREPLAEWLPAGVFNERARTFRWHGKQDPKAFDGVDPAVAIVSAGASDAFVAEEVAETLTFLRGARPLLRQDCGVAGLHRLLSRLEELEQSRVVIAVAGMDGVLPTIVAGLVSRPIIAVPTSVGYGPGAGGLTPLLTMLSSCAPGLVVVNVDNGVGAAFAATRILHVCE